MRSGTVGTVVALALAGSASADVTFSRMDIRARAFGSSDPWSQSLTLQSVGNAPIVLEVGVFYNYSQGYGFRQAIHTIVGSPYSGAQGDLATILDRPDSGQHPDGRVGQFNFGGAQPQVVYHTGTSGVDANRFRISLSHNETDNPAGGLDVYQNAPGNGGNPAFDTSNPAYGYHFKLSLACYGSGRTVTIDSPLNKVTLYQSYKTFASTSSSADLYDLRPELLATSAATITVSWVPAPATVAVTGMGALAMGRRRCSV